MEFVRIRQSNQIFKGEMKNTLETFKNLRTTPRIYAQKTLKL